MARATCFRCDWEGEADGEACPNCGAALYRPAPRSEGAPATPAPRTRPSRPASPRSEFLPLEAPAEGAASRPPRTAQAFAAFVVLAAVVTGTLWWFLRAHEVPVGVQATSPPPNGHLVYTTAGSGGARLWSWDPRTGAATDGPAVEGKVLQLVSAQGALAGWLGVTTRTSEDLLEASILRSQAPDAQPVKIFTADLVAWGPNGASVVSAGLGSPTNGCYAKLAVYREELDTYSPGVQAPVYRHTQFCGEIPTLGQTLASTYFTWVREDGTGIYFLGNGDPHEVLNGWSLLSVSPTSDLIVQPADHQGSALFWRGADVPDLYHGTDGSPVIVSDVLTWTTGADAALVVATVEGRQGLYLLDTTPGGTRVPRYVGVARSPVYATAAFDGSLYIAMEYQVLVYRDQHLFEVTLPEGAPRPDGPIAWMPG